MNQDQEHFQGSKKSSDLSQEQFAPSEEDTLNIIITTELEETHISMKTMEVLPKCISPFHGPMLELFRAPNFMLDLPQRLLSTPSPCFIELTEVEEIHI